MSFLPSVTLMKLNFSSTAVINSEIQRIEAWGEWRRRHKQKTGKYTLLK